MADRRCSMVIDWTTTPDGGPDGAIVCGKPASRALGGPPAQIANAHPDAGMWLDGCCDDCFETMRASGDYTQAEMDELYPRVAEPCDHGLTFDQEAADQIRRETTEPSSGDEAIDFIVGPVNATAEIRRRWPRGCFTEENPCPKGCGFVGIAYASPEHYAYGDW